MSASVKQFFHRYGPAMVIAAVLVVLYLLLRGESGDAQAVAQTANPAGTAASTPYDPSELTTPGYQRWNYAPVTFNLGGDVPPPSITPYSDKSGSGCGCGGSQATQQQNCAGCTTFGTGGPCLAATPAKQAKAMTLPMKYAATNIASFGNGG